jgi:outer membrane protein
MRVNIVRLSSVTLIPFAAVLTSAAALALPADNESGEESSYSWGLGVAGIATQKAYTGIHRDDMLIPVVYFENRWIQLIGPALDFKLPEISWSQSNVLSFGARVEYDGSGYRQGEAAILNGMAERKNGILAGVAARWEGSLLSVSVAAMFDATSVSKGRRFSLGLERTFFVGEHVAITPSATAIQLDNKYANYYFGVLPAEARGGRAAYAPGRTMNTSLGIRTDYMRGDHHALFLQAEYTALGSGIRSSPLTDRGGESMLIVGYMFRF